MVKFSPTAEEFTTAVFASSTCSHRSRKLILCGGHSATFSVFSIYFGPNNNSLTQLYTHLMVHATTRTETGLEWELIVQYAAYMQRSIVWADRLELANWATNRIYGVLHCNSLVSAREINTAELLTLENVTIVIFMPYAKHDVAQNLDNYSFNSFYAN